MSIVEIKAAVETLINPDAIEVAKVVPYYEVNNKGVFYVGIKADGEEFVHQPPQYLCDPIHLIGSGTDAEGSYYRVIKWRDAHERKDKVGVFALADLGTATCWPNLRRLGLNIPMGRQKQERIAEYLQREGDKDHWAITDKGGWHKENAYILPSGEVLGKSKDRILYNGDKSQAQAYEQSGTLTQWQNQVGSMVKGNSRLCLGVGSALAAPLMRLMGIEGGGFHLFGDSSDGKTTTAMVGLSVWGNPDLQKMSWEGTGLGFSNVAHSKNDGLMVLDEIGQARAHVVAQTAYSVINGTGKAQGAKEGGNRALNKWRVLVLSTGEKALETFLKAGKGEWHAGQANRLPSIPADAGKGLRAFDTIHGFESGAVFAEALNERLQAYHGTLGRAFVEAIVNDTSKAKERIKYFMDDFMAVLPGNATGQARRVCTRFALVASALELAAEYDLMPIDVGEGSSLIKQCFNDWLMREGVGNYEDRQILEQAHAFFEQNGYSARFIAIPFNDLEQKPVNHAGYREAPATTDDPPIFYVFPSAFKSEVARGFDHLKVCEVLNAAGWLKDKSGKSWQHLKRLGTGKAQRFYVFLDSHDGSSPND